MFFCSFKLLNLNTKKVLRDCSCCNNKSFTQGPPINLINLHNQSVHPRLDWLANFVELDWLDGRVDWGSLIDEIAIQIDCWQVWWCVHTYNDAALSAEKNWSYRASGPKYDADNYAWVLSGDSKTDCTGFSQSLVKDGLHAIVLQAFLLICRADSRMIDSHDCQVWFWRLISIKWHIGICC